MDTQPQGIRPENFEVVSRVKDLKAARKRWTLIFLVLVFLAYFVPYTFLTDIPKVYGAFL